MLIPPMCICAGILWNLSSKDNLKEKLAKETLRDLTEKILIPLSDKGGDSEGIELTPSESEIFYNTTGCLRCSSQTSPCGLVILYTSRLLCYWSGCTGSLTSYRFYSQESELCERKDPTKDERDPRTCGLFGALY